MNVMCLDEHLILNVLCKLILSGSDAACLKPKKTTKSKTTTSSTPMDVDHQVLIRAVSQSHKKKKKISTLVNSKDWNRFSMAYGNLLKANVDGLEKKSKKDRRMMKKKVASS